MIASVAAVDVPPPGAGFVTVIEAVPAAAISAAVIAAVTCPPLLNVVARGDPLKFTTEVEIKFVPFTINENATPPAVAALGTSELIVGTGFGAALTLKLTEFDVPPPGVGFVTLTAGVPTVATSVARIDAINCVALTNVVVLGAPPKFTVEVEIKFAPFTVNVNPAEPAVAPVGEREAMLGRGLPLPVPVMVKVMAFEGAPPGFVTITEGVPGLATSVAATTAMMKLELSTSVGSTLEPNVTLAPGKKFVPKTLRTNTPDPAATVVGDNEVIVTTGVMTLNVTEFEGPPPGAGFVTTTAGVPPAAISVVRIAAVSCVMLTKVVVFAAPPKLTTEVGVNPVPFTVNVNAGFPALMFVGEIVVIAGTGFVPVML